MTRLRLVRTALLRPEVRAIVAAAAECSPGLVTAESRLDQLNLDKLGRYRIAADLERQLIRTVPHQDVLSWVTAGDVQASFDGAQ